MDKVDSVGRDVVHGMAQQARTMTFFQIRMTAAEAVLVLPDWMSVFVQGENEPVDVVVARGTRQGKIKSKQQQQTKGGSTVSSSCQSY